MAARADRVVNDSKVSSSVGSGSVVKWSKTQTDSSPVARPAGRRRPCAPRRARIPPVVLAGPSLRQDHSDVHGRNLTRPRPPAIVGIRHGRPYTAGRCAARHFRASWPMSSTTGPRSKHSSTAVLALAAAGLAPRVLSPVSLRPFRRPSRARPELDAAAALVGVVTAATLLLGGIASDGLRTRRLLQGGLLALALAAGVSLLIPAGPCSSRRAWRAPRPPDSSSRSPLRSSRPRTRESRGPRPSASRMPPTGPPRLRPRSC